MATFFFIKARTHAPAQGIVGQSSGKDWGEDERLKKQQLRWVKRKKNIKSRTMESEIEQYKAKVRFPGNKKPKPVAEVEKH